MRFSLRTIYSSNKPLIYSLLFLGVYSTTLVFAAPPTSPYVPSDNITDPACAPGDTNCYVLVSSLPAQTGNTNRLLFTDGTDAAWASGITWDETTDAFTVASGASKTLLLDPANNIYKFGDIDNKNNNINLTLDDANTEVNIFTELGGVTYSMFRLNPAIDNSLDNQVFIGLGAGRGASAAYHSNFIGYRAGEGGTNASFSNFFGFRAGENAQNATNSNFFGQRAGNLANSGSYSNIFGFNAGNSAIGSNNIVIGTNITLPNAATNAINIGGVLFGTGTYSTITGSPSSDPVSGGRIGIGTIAPSETLEVVGNIVSKGTSWTSRSSAADNNWTSVTYGNGTFVAVSSTGTLNRVMTSSDGINWTARSNAGEFAWSGVTYGNGLFVAVSGTANGNDVMTSPDGITWTNRLLPISEGWTSVTYGNGTFVAVAQSGTNRVMTSYDGINWTARTAAATNQWKSVTYGNGTFVAVAQSGTNRVMTSPDGITWTARSASASNTWVSVVYGNGLFVATASFCSSNCVMTSPDGITWTNRTASANNNWFSTTYGNGLFVSIAALCSSNCVMTSPDGITWTNRTASANNNWNSVTYGNGTFVAVSSSGTGNRVMTSGKTDYIPFSESNIYQDGFRINGLLGIGLGASAPSFRIDALEDTASTYVARLFHDGNAVDRFGLLIQAGRDDNSLAGASTLVSFRDGDGTAVGSITFESSLTNYNTTSDERLKENIVDTALSIDLLKQIRIRDYTWKADATHKLSHGVIAQELHQVYPLAVTVPMESSGYWMVDYSKLVPLIVKSVQDLDIRIMPLSDLSLSSSNTLGSMIKKFIEDISTKFDRIFVKRAVVEELCLEDGTCITQNEIRFIVNMYRNQSGQNYSGGSTSSPQVEDEITEPVNQPEEIESIETQEESGEPEVQESSSIEADTATPEVTE